MKRTKLEKFLIATFAAGTLAACDSENGIATQDTNNSPAMAETEQQQRDTTRETVTEGGDNEPLITDQTDGTPGTENRLASGSAEETANGEDADIADINDVGNDAYTGTQTQDTQTQPDEEPPGGDFITDDEETRSDIVAKEQQTVQFEFDSASLTEEAKTKLEDFVDAIEEREKEAVEMVIRGYTDTRGSEAYNERLAERRATAVKDFLVQQGLTADNLEIKAIGEAPDENIAATIQDNRRVVVEVVVPYADELDFS